MITLDAANTVASLSVFYTYWIHFIFSLDGMPAAQLSIIKSRQNIGKKVQIHNEGATGSVTKKCGLS